MPQDYSQLGVATITLLILFFIVRYFIRAIEKKDTYIKNLTETFSQTVSAHITTQLQQTERQMQLLETMSNVLTHHTELLELHTNAFIKLGGIPERRRQERRSGYDRRKS